MPAENTTAKSGTTKIINIRRTFFLHFMACTSSFPSFRCHKKEERSISIFLQHQEYTRITHLIHIPSETQPLGTITSVSRKKGYLEEGGTAAPQVSSGFLLLRRRTAATTMTTMTPTATSKSSVGNGSTDSKTSMPPTV